MDTEQAVMSAKKFLEDMLSFFGLNTDVKADIEDGQVIMLSVPSTYLNGFLIGQNGDTMRAMQFLISNMLKNQGHDIYRVNVDVADYKKSRLSKLEEQATKWIAEVKKSGEPKELRPMNPAERRFIHQFAADNDLTTESIGEGRDRHIVLKPKE